MITKKLNSVLLVDDDEATNYLNSEFIEESAITDNIEVAMNGAEAIEFLRSALASSPRSIPELIVLDINMPVMNGWEFIEAFRTLNGVDKNQITIAMLSASLNPEDKSRAEQIKEVSLFKTKPLDQEVINEIMKSYFPDYI
jgi:CheY-like chemotaxis protein